MVAPVSTTESTCREVCLKFSRGSNYIINYLLSHAGLQGSQLTKIEHTTFSSLQLASLEMMDTVLVSKEQSTWWDQLAKD